MFVRKECREQVAGLRSKSEIAADHDLSFVSFCLIIKGHLLMRFWRVSVWLESPLNKRNRRCI